MGWIIGAILGLVTAALTWVTLRRQFPKRELTWSTKTTPLISLTTDRLHVTLDDQVLKAPYLTTVTLSSKSRADIPSPSFNDADPIIFKIDAENNTCIHLETTGDITVDPPHQDTNETPVYSVPAQLIRKNAQAEFKFVTSGQPKVNEPQDSLIDIPVSQTVSGSSYHVTGRRAQILIVLGGITTGAFVMVIAVILAWFFVQ